MEAALAIVSVLFVLAAGTAWVLWRLHGRLLDQRSQLQLQLDNTRQSNIELDKNLAVLKQRHADDEARLAEFRTQIDNHLKALAGEALKQSNTQFLQLADEKLKPIRDLLDKYNTHYQQIEQSRKTEYGGLKQITESLKSQTESLVTALRRPEVRGRWGEIALQRIVELAGLKERSDFHVQSSIDTEEGRLRPDMTVHLPNDRVIVIDSKITLDAFLDAAKLPEGAQRSELLQRHVGQINEQVRRLSSKAYWDQFERSPDFVVLFINVESALYAAMETDGELLERAMGQNVVIATPTLLIALLKAVEIGWREQQVAENAAQIMDLGRELHERLATALGHVDKVGSSLDTTVKNYNALVGSLATRLMPAARKFEQLGTRSAKELPGSLDPVVTLPKPVESADTRS